MAAQEIADAFGLVDASQAAINKETLQSRGLLRFDLKQLSNTLRQLIDGTRGDQGRAQEWIEETYLRNIHNVVLDYVKNT